MRYIFFGLVLILSTVSWSFDGDMGAGTEPLTDGSADYPYLIEDMVDFDRFADPGYAALYWIAGAHTQLMTDLDLSGRVYPTAVIAPDGLVGTSFSGTFDGNDAEITNLSISCPGDRFIGLFGLVDSAGEIKNLGLVNVDISGNTYNSYVGGLCGFNDGGTITDCSVNIGTVSGIIYTGGVCGENSGTISGCHALLNVIGNEWTGGLCGHNTGVLLNCYSKGPVTEPEDFPNDSVGLGGLCGWNSDNGVISDSYATGNVSGYECLGGLCGLNENWISGCYAAGAAVGDNVVGGLCGQNTDRIDTSYSTGSVEGDEYSYEVGGLCGANTGAIEECYSRGAVTGNEAAGGLSGANYGMSTIYRCYWDVESSGRTVGYTVRIGGVYPNYTYQAYYSTPGIAEGVTTAQLQLQETFAGWDFAATWGMDVFAVLQWQDLSEVADGSSHDPYLIRNLSDFDDFADSAHAVKYWSSGVHTRLMADIDLSSRTYSRAVIEQYAGVFDGNDFAIQNLTIDADGVAIDHLGLFGLVDGDGSEIRRLGIKNITISNAGLVDYAGGLAGSILSGQVERCYSTGSIQGYSHVGGLAGGIGTGVSVRECSSSCAVIGDLQAGGFCGVNAGQVNDCYATGAVQGAIGSKDVSGFCGESEGTLLNCYSAGAVTGGGTYAGFCGVNHSDITTHRCYWDIETSGTTIAYHVFNSGSYSPVYSIGGVTEGKTTLQMQTQSTFVGWDFDEIWVMLAYPSFAWEVAEDFEDGSAEHPYLIEDLSDFDAFADPLNAGMYWASGVHTRLMTDIDLSGRTYDTAVIAPDTEIDPLYQGESFQGVFDGGGFAVQNLTIDTAGFNHCNLGLFGLIEGPDAQVQNLGIEQATIIGGDSSHIAGALAASIISGRVSNCYSIGSVRGGGYSHYVGGLTGTLFSGTVSRCYSTGSVDGYSYVGGLSGSTDSGGTLTGCYSRCFVRGIKFGIGGLVGLNGAHGVIHNCYATGATCGESFVGGLVGSNGGLVDAGSISNCYSTGPVTVSGSNVGGLVGYDGFANVVNSFWDVDTSGIGSSGSDNYGAIGKHTAELFVQNTFAGWNFVSDWIMHREGQDYPRLAWQAVLSSDVAGLFGVNMADVAYLSQYWGLDGCDTGTDCGLADIDGSGDVGLGDLAAMADDWLR